MKWCRRAPHLRACAVALAASLAASCGVFDTKAPTTVPPEDFALTCPLYCAVVMHRCKSPMTGYTSLDHCLRTCALLPQEGQVGSISGNTLQCRFTFAMAAHNDTRHIFCRNAGASGGTSCR